MAAKYHINPRIRAYGKARIDITRRASDESEWQSKWRAPLHSYPFTPGEGWQFCFEYKVDDFAAEVGFFIDVLGFEVRAFSPSYAQFTDPYNDFCFGVAATQEGEQSTDPETIRLQFNVDHILETVKTLEMRGIVFQQPPVPISGQPHLLVGYFRSPHGVCIDLFGEISLDDEDDDYPREEEEDEAETDRRIKEILGLSADPDDDIDEEEFTYEDEAEAEDLDEGQDEEISDEEDEETIHEISLASLDHQRSPETVRTPFESDLFSYSKTNPSPKNRRPVNSPSNRFPHLSTRGQTNILPPHNGKRVAELTYQEIEDDSGPLEED